MGEERQQRVGEHQHQLLHEVARALRQGVSGQLHSAQVWIEAAVTGAFSDAGQAEAHAHVDAGTPQSEDLCGSRTRTVEPVQIAAERSAADREALTKNQARPLGRARRNKGLFCDYFMFVGKIHVDQRRSRPDPFALAHRRSARRVSRATS
ncbi:hypothetical protein PSP6_470065 [Paraburkholderia tropica]|nr:hypothetical protein PSP6_470065 [Paraburkholderia tropica]